MLRQVNTMNWPDGPEDLNALFQWPSYNCMCLTDHHLVGDFCIANALAISQCDIYVNDSYSGTGTGFVTLVMQHDHMKRSLSVSIIYVNVVSWFHTGFIWIHCWSMVSWFHTT